MVGGLVVNCSCMFLRMGGIVVGLVLVGSISFGGLGRFVVLRLFSCMVLLLVVFMVVLMGLVVVKLCGEYINVWMLLVVVLNGLNSMCLLGLLGVVRLKLSLLICSVVRLVVLVNGVDLLLDRCIIWLVVLVVKWIL